MVIKLKHLIKMMIVIIPLLTGCEDISVVESDINHVEKIVVYSKLQSDSTFRGVSFTKTLPINETYDIKKAEIKNVVCYLKINSAQVIPLHYEKDGVYKPRYKITISEGNVYELYARINGKYIYSRTITPLLPVVHNASYASGEFIEADVHANEGEVYGSRWVILTGGTTNSAVRANDFHSIVKVSAFNDTLAFTRTSSIPEEYRNNFYRDRRYIQVYAFDEAYLEFFKTKNNNQPIEDIFAQGGGPINWNVYGENVIGLFIGVTESAIVKAQSN